MFHSSVSTGYSSLLSVILANLVHRSLRITFNRDRSAIVPLSLSLRTFELGICCVFHPDFSTWLTSLRAKHRQLHLPHSHFEERDTCYRFIVISESEFGDLVMLIESSCVGRFLFHPQIIYEISKH